ncbi:hypothetical protein LVJ83_10610 [Uruburuella testudinis]|uniref:Uncharacterized protein n=1 Tax=Uruburuella testudinis TaxID=1282863 RepID=A0ABY4DQT9_9NEIS|nr:hypothetical protein [Uruburuella testudinis]UOO81400.1 hypothetical protein LVJ83_10610 [Uruburuella testudinis]
MIANYRIPTDARHSFIQANKVAEAARLAGKTNAGQNAQRQAQRQPRMSGQFVYEGIFAPENADARQKTQQDWTSCEAF